MTGVFSMSHASNCCGNTAVAGTSVRICNVLDTAVVAVSILIVRVRDLLVRLW